MSVVVVFWVFVCVYARLVMDTMKWISSLAVVLLAVCAFVKQGESCTESGVPVIECER